MTRFIGETRRTDEPQFSNPVIVDADTLAAANAEVHRHLPSDWELAWLRKAPA